MVPIAALVKSVPSVASAQHSRVEATECGDSRLPTIRCWSCVRTVPLDGDSSKSLQTPAEDGAVWTHLSCIVVLITEFTVLCSCPYSELWIVVITEWWSCVHLLSCVIVLFGAAFITELQNYLYYLVPGICVERPEQATATHGGLELAH